MKETEAIELLKQYMVCKKFLDSQIYAEEYYNTHNVDKKELYEARMHIVESLVQILEPSNEATILHLHYIKGLSVEKSAECMGLSRRTAYRILKRSYGSLCDLINEKRGYND